VSTVREAFVNAGILKPDVLGDDAFIDARIVLELAEYGPMVENLGAGFGRCRWCAMEARDTRMFDDPAFHAFECLWRRARERYPKESA
jgi:hypothetical protein